MCSDTTQNEPQDATADEPTTTERARKVSTEVSRAYSLARVLAATPTEDEQVLCYMPDCFQLLAECLDAATTEATDIFCILRHRPTAVIAELQAEVDKEEGRRAAEKAEYQAEIDARTAEKAKAFNTDIPNWDELDGISYYLKHQLKYCQDADGPDRDILNEARQLAERIDRLIKKPEAVTEGQP